MENNRCAECGIEFSSKRKDAKFCSPKCRVTFSRKDSLVTDNVTLSEVPVTDKFEYTQIYLRKPGDKGYDQEMAEKCATVRSAEYWYDVPLGAVPVLHKGWPEMPVYMNGRQYFLWWKNEFKKSGEGDETGAIILNPFPIYDKTEYVKAGEGSRYWGTV